ncbi:MAG: hypothetical protein LBV23_05890 [Deltaproteobacteria bacterium]|nr:hypothetical protein [Deltaproteobacteria bacterium]
MSKFILTLAAALLLAFGSNSLQAQNQTIKIPASAGTQGLNISLSPPAAWSVLDVRSPKYLSIFSTGEGSGDDFFFAAVAQVKSLPIGFTLENLKNPNASWNQTKLIELWKNLAVKAEGQQTLKPSPEEATVPFARLTSFDRRGGVTRYLEINWTLVNDKIVELECGANSLTAKEGAFPEAKIKVCDDFFKSLVAK